MTWIMSSWHWSCFMSALSPIVSVLPWSVYAVNIQSCVAVKMKHATWTVLARYSFTRGHRSWCLEGLYIEASFDSLVWKPWCFEDVQRLSAQVNVQRIPNVLVRNSSVLMCFLLQILAFDWLADIASRDKFYIASPVYTQFRKLDLGFITLGTSRIHYTSRNIPPLCQEILLHLCQSASFSRGITAIPWEVHAAKVLYFQQLNDSQTLLRGHSASEDSRHS